MLMVINHMIDRVDQTRQISAMKTKRLQTHNDNSRDISPAQVEEISDSEGE